MADVADTRVVDANVETCEIAYRDMPPALEDPTIQGLWRIPNKQRLRTIEQRDDCEYDYRWYRYASHSAWLLTFIFLLAVASLSLSLWQNNGNLGHQLDGVPRTLIPQSVKDSDDQAGITEHLWQVRSLGAITAGLAAIIGIKLYFESSSVGFGSIGQLKLVKLQYVLAAFLAFVGIVSYVVAFSMAIGNVKDVVNAAEGFRFTFEEPENREDIATWVTTFDMICFGLGIAALYVLVRHGLLQGDLVQEVATWKQQSRVRDMDEKGPVRWYQPRRAPKEAPAVVEEEITDGVPSKPKKEKKAARPAFILRDHFHNVRFVKSTFGLIVLFALLASCIISAAGFILLHEYRYQGRYYTTRGLSAAPVDFLEADDDDAVRFNGPTADFERTGWPVQNQRLRLGVAAAIIAIWLFLLVPWRHRLIHWVVHFLLAIAVVGFCASFAKDVITLHEVKDQPCPMDWASSLATTQAGTLSSNTVAGAIVPYHCSFHLQQATVVLSFFIFFFGVVYLVLELFLRKRSARKEKDPNTGKMVVVPQSGRKYGIFEANTMINHLDSMRKVKCSVTGETMVAKYYVYRHMFDVRPQQ